MLAFGGTSRYDMSVCHTDSPSPKPPIGSPPSCLPAPKCTMQLPFRKVAAAFGHATFNNDAALVRGFGKAR